MVEFEELWCEYVDEVRLFLRRRCHDRDLADDLTNETFLHAGRAIDKKQEVTIGWLMTVARRRLVDHWRRSANHDAAIQRVAYELSFRLDNESTLVLPSIEHVDLETALDNLCVTQRMALELRYCHGHTVETVANELDLSYRAAESVLARGRRNLKNVYAPST